jgi:predicted ATPase
VGTPARGYRASDLGDVGLHGARRFFPHRVRTGIALLTLLPGLAERSPVLVVDDAHWADRASLDVISFAAHRLRLSPEGRAFPANLT